jgi:hypothetical protein
MAEHGAKAWGGRVQRHDPAANGFVKCGRFAASGVASALECCFLKGQEEW